MKLQLAILALVFATRSFAQPAPPAAKPPEAKQPEVIESGDVPTEYQSVSARLWAVQQRMEVRRTDFARVGMSFKIRIFPPEKPAFDPAEFSDLSEFAATIGVPCKRVQIALKSHGPTGAADLDVPLGLQRYDPDGSILIQIHLPKTHSGHENGHPHLILVCSEIHAPSGDVIDWIPVILTLEERMVTGRSLPSEEADKAKARTEALYRSLDSPSPGAEKSSK